MAEEVVLYRASLTGDKGRSVVVKQVGRKLTLTLEGFGQPITLDVNGGGTSTCRTILEHNSDQAAVVLSLAIPDPRAPCRMLPSSVSIESRVYNISIDEETLKKAVGSKARLRSAVEKNLGKIESEGE